MKTSTLKALSIALSVSFSFGCGLINKQSGNDNPARDPAAAAAPETLIDIIGSYSDAYSTDHNVTRNTWLMTFSSGTALFRIHNFDNTDKHMVAQNDSENTYNPNKWSRFDWTYVGADLYYCQTTYNKDTYEEAKATSRADDSSPAGSGCGGFAWSKITLK